MRKLKIEKSLKANDTVTRTIRISGKTFDKISELAEKNKLSFNNVINQIIEYGLSNLEEWLNTLFSLIISYKKLPISIDIILINILK